MNYAQAIGALKAGKRVKRAVWENWIYRDAYCCVRFKMAPELIESLGDSFIAFPADEAATDWEVVK